MTVSQPLGGPGEDTYYIHLIRPVAGIRGTFFTFASEDIAEDWRSGIHAAFPDAETEVGQVGSLSQLRRSLSKVK